MPTNMTNKISKDLNHGIKLTQSHFVVEYKWTVITYNVLKTKKNTRGNGHFLKIMFCPFVHVKA
jgi:hypothetical protein